MPQSLRVTVAGVDAPFDGFLDATSLPAPTAGPRRAVYAPVTLTRPYAGYDDLTRWRDSIVAGNVDRRMVTVERVGADAVLARVDLLDAWISRWEMPDLGSVDANEKIELTFEAAIAG